MSKRRCRMYQASLEDPLTIAQPFLIAKGSPASRGKAAAFTLAPGLTLKAPEGKDADIVDHRAFNAAIVVEKDEFLGTFVPGAEGETGTDVYGEELQAAKRGNDVTLSPTVQVVDAEEDKPSYRVIATLAGRVRLEDGEVRIEEVNEVPGDVDFTTGNITSAVDFTVRGNVLDNFVVESKMSVTVIGLVQAAKIIAGEDIILQSGIAGRSKGSLSAGGQITAKFAEEGSLRAVGDIQIGRSLMNSKLQTKSRLLAPTAYMRGGKALARESAMIGEVGTESGLPTTVIVGMAPQAVIKLTKLDKLLADAIVKAARNEKDERLQKRVAKMKAVHAEILSQESPEGTPTLTVMRIIHPGVTVQIGRLQTLFKRESQGPLQIELKTDEEMPILMLKNINTGWTTTLPCTDITKRSSKRKRSRRFRRP